MLSISDNDFGGTLPRELFKLPHLREIGIAWTYINGTIPYNIGRAKTLSKSYHPLLEALGEICWIIYISISQSLALETINFGRTELSGTLPDSLYQLKNLESLNLHMNKFEGSIKPKIGKLGSLRHLSLWSNNFTGTIPSELGRCEELGAWTWFFIVHDGP